MKTSNAIKQNIKAHDIVYNNYEKIHGEIFNQIEQQRLYTHLKQAIVYLEKSSVHLEALDYGCGTGNLTKHLIDLGFYVTAADVSRNFLQFVKEKFGHTKMLEILAINGYDLSNIKNDRFDFVATYSVLHHVPDYLQIVREMIRVTKPGGVIYLDHEANESSWSKNQEHLQFLKELPKPRKKFSRFFKLANYIIKIRQLKNPRYQPEGDIHVWPDDHIDWNEIEGLLTKRGCAIILKDDYLLYKKDYPENVYQAYKNKCSDMRVLIARKKLFSAG